MPFQQVTLAQLQAEMADRLDGSPFWTPEEARLGLNEALRTWNLLTGQWRARSLVPVTGGSPWVSLPSSLTWTARVEWQGLLVDQSNLSDLDNGRPRWEGQTTADGGEVPDRPRLWAPAGLRLLALWPSPAADAPSSLLVDGLAATPVLVKMSDWLDLGRQEHDAILFYALHYCAFKEGAGRFAGSITGLKAFYAAAIDRNTRLLASTLFRAWVGLDVERTARPDRRQVTADAGAGAAGTGQ